MAIRDRYGLPLSTGSTAAAEHYAEGVDLFLSLNFGPEEAFRRAVEEDEGFALAHAGISEMQMMRGEVEEAKASAERAAALAAGCLRWERRRVEAVSLFVNGRGAEALALIREQLDECPREALSLRMANRLFVLGCSGAGVADYPPDLLMLLKEAEPHYGDDWAFLGQYAFAHHECGLFDEALRHAERSLEQRPANANASHSVAHVFFETGDADGGGDFLGEWLTDYDSRSPFHVHLSWHLALFELAMGRYDRVFDIYDTQIRPSVKDRSPLSLADSASLMWRIQMYGGTPPPFPWRDVAEQAAPAAKAPGPGFRGRPRSAGLRGGRRRDLLPVYVGRPRGYGGEGERPRRRDHSSAGPRHRRLRRREVRRGGRADRAPLSPAHAPRRKPRPAGGVRGHPAGGVPPLRAVRQGRGAAQSTAEP